MIKLTNKLGPLSPTSSLVGEEMEPLRQAGAVQELTRSCAGQITGAAKELTCSCAWLADGAARELTHDCAGIVEDMIPCTGTGLGYSINLWSKAEAVLQTLLGGCR